MYAWVERVDEELVAEDCDLDDVPFIVERDKNRLRRESKKVRVAWHRM